MVTREETKVENKTQCDYELVLILRPEIGDEALEPMIESISQLITGKGGVVSEIQRWGKKKLAYPIKHLLEGNYVLVRFKFDPSLNKELEANLKISEKVLRYLLVTLSS